MPAQRRSSSTVRISERTSWFRRRSSLKQPTIRSRIRLSRSRKSNERGGVMNARVPDEEIFAKHGFKCVYCGFDGRTLENWRFLQVDHFKPRSLGSDYNVTENLVTSCIICN